MDEKNAIKKVDTINKGETTNKVKNTESESNKIEKNKVIEQKKVLIKIAEKKVDEPNKVANESNKVVDEHNKEEKIEEKTEKKWTQKEDEKLYKIANDFIENNNNKGDRKKKRIDWFEVSVLMKRDKQECANRYYNKLKERKANERKVKWTEDEDKKLIEFTNEIKNFKEVDIPSDISKKMENRTSKEVRMRLKKLKKDKMVDFKNRRVVPKTVNKELFKEELRKIEDEELKIMNNKLDILNRRKMEIKKIIK